MRPESALHAVQRYVTPDMTAAASACHPHVGFAALLGAILSPWAAMWVLVAESRWPGVLLGRHLSGFELGSQVTRPRTSSRNSLGGGMSRCLAMANGSARFDS